MSPSTTWVGNADSYTDPGCDYEVIATSGQNSLSSCYQCLDNYNGTFVDRLLNFAIQQLMEVHVWCPAEPLPRLTTALEDRKDGYYFSYVTITMLAILQSVLNL
jgi:hypothetical protein